VRVYAVRVSLGLLLVMLLVAVAGCSTATPPGTVTLPPVTALQPVTIPSTQVESNPEVEGVVTVYPGTDLASLVEDAAEGLTFMLQPGVHRGQRVEPKDGMSFIGSPGAVMSGGQILTGFRSIAEDVWLLEGVSVEGRDHGECIDDYDGCSFTQDLFMDDVMLWQVTELDDLESGSWYRDGEDAYIADDPTNRRIEISVTPYAFISAADDVEIRGIAIEKYATPAQVASIQSQEPAEGAKGSNWLIVDVEVSGVHGVGIRTGDQTVIRNAYIHHNGQLGISVSGGTGVVVEDSRIAHNNTAGFLWEWEAGGVKATNCTDVVFRGNSVHDNNGPGLWADIDCVNTLYEDNVVVDNAGPGIYHEISGRAVVRHNVVERNGSDDSSWLWGAGILVAASSDVEVYENTVTDNGNGIAGIQQDRGIGRYGERLLTGLNVHHNTVRLGQGRVGIAEDVGDESVFNDRNNRFESNTYIEAAGYRYFWENSRMKRAGWIAAGQDTLGTWK
jgi:parallel beta-helix repeat protein